MPEQETKTCQAIIDLSSPTGHTKVRGFQPPWRTVFIYTCKACGNEHRVRANAFSGKNPAPGVGGIRCGAKL